MAHYQVTGRNSGGGPIVSVSITSIDQETPVVPELEVVNAVRDLLASKPGVASVGAQRYEQVVTTV